MSYNKNSDDILSNEYRLYIEGVQVPFLGISITQTYKQAPSATISVPPFPGLSEIGRNYQPKVHIFYKDYNLGVPRYSKSFKTTEDSNTAVKNSYRLLFSGIITSNSEAKSVSASGGSQSVSLTAEHHSTILEQILFKYGNISKEAAGRTTDATNASGIAVIGESNYGRAMVRALEGIYSGGPEEDTDGVNIRYDHGKFERLKGIPSLMVVIWNMLKRDAAQQVMSNDTEALTDMYIPLVEKGIKFWQKLSGHDLIESGLNTNRSTDVENYRVEDADATNKFIIPPLWRTFLGDAAQIRASQMAVSEFNNSTPSDEIHSFGSHIVGMLDSVGYEIVTLASPIIKSNGDITEYIAKPTITNYYAPICNVLLPNLINNVQVNNSYREIPTRINCIQNPIAGTVSIRSGGKAYNYTSPHSVRKSRAGENSDLSQSTASFTNKVGKYEWGQGIRSKTLQMPQTYSLLQSVMERREEDDDDNISDKENYQLAVSAWNKLYSGSEKFNPLNPESGIKNFQRMPFLYVDSLFANSAARARTASVTGVFNPYPIVGYPMDVIDAMPSRESYHGMCISITHNISANGSASTSYQLASVSTISELAKFNLPAVNPYLMAVLGFEDDVRIYGNNKAYKAACKLYTDVLEVGAAEPAILQNYDTGTMQPITRTKGFWGIGGDGTVNNMHNVSTVLGSLNLVARNITSMNDVEKDSGNTFISIEDWVDMDHTITPSNVVHSHSRIKDHTTTGGKINTPGEDVESSPFLDYGD